MLWAGSVKNRKTLREQQLSRINISRIVIRTKIKGTVKKETNVSGIVNRTNIRGTVKKENKCQWNS